MQGVSDLLAWWWREPPSDTYSASTGWVRVDRPGRGKPDLDLPIRCLQVGPWPGRSNTNRGDSLMPRFVSLKRSVIDRLSISIMSFTNRATAIANQLQQTVDSLLTTSNRMNPADPTSFNLREVTLSTGRHYRVCDEKPEGYVHGEAPVLILLHGFPEFCECRSRHRAFILC